MNNVQDIIRQPIDDYTELTNKEKDKLRQTQVFDNEVVQVLGRHESFYLIRKFEKTLGWVPAVYLTIDHDLADFARPVFPQLAPMEFLNNWKATVYEFGGLSKLGIDCSGLTQQYFLDVHGVILPKNSRDQLKLGVQNDLKNIKTMTLFSVTLTLKTHTMGSFVKTVQSL
jgi:hypothetical protein